MSFDDLDGIPDDEFEDWNDDEDFEDLEDDDSYYQKRYLDHDEKWEDEEDSDDSDNESDGWYLPEDEDTL